MDGAIAETKQWMLAFAHRLLNDVELEDPLAGLRVVRVKFLGIGRLSLRGLILRLSLTLGFQNKATKRWVFRSLIDHGWERKS